MTSPLPNEQWTFSTEGTGHRAQLTMKLPNGGTINISLHCPLSEAIALTHHQQWTLQQAGNHIAGSLQRLASRLPPQA